MRHAKINKLPAIFRQLTRKIMTEMNEPNFPEFEEYLKNLGKLSKIDFSNCTYIEIYKTYFELALILPMLGGYLISEKFTDFLR